MIRRMWERVRAKAQQVRLRFWTQYNTYWRDAVWPRYTLANLVNDGYCAHATVFACVQLYATTFPEAKLRAWRVSDGGREQEDHEAVRLLQQPNHYMSESDFWRYFITYAAVGGLACVWKERDRTGKVIGLWPLHRGVIGPVKPDQGWQEVWEYDPGDGITPIHIPVRDIIDYRWAIDPNEPLDGLSPLVACARAVDTGDEALRYVYALLKNDAVPRTAVASKSLIPDSIRDRMLAQFEAQYGEDNRGRPMLFEGQDVTVTRVGANLQELGTDALHSVPDAWITMAYQVPAVFLGTPGGMQRAIQGAPREMMEYWTETVRIPRWREVAEVFTRKLLVEEYGDDSGELVLDFDTSRVRALTEDDIARRASISAALTAGWLTVNEARAADGREELTGGDVFLRAPTVVEVAAEAAPSATPVEPGESEAKADPWVPDDPGQDQPLPDAEDVMEAEDVATAAADWDRWARVYAPDLVGLLAGKVKR